MRNQPPKKLPGQGTGPRRISGTILLDVRSASALCGFSEKQTRGLVARRLIPFRRLGGRLVFIKTELETWAVSLAGCTLAEAVENREKRYARK